jgi:hypothetical protein
LIYNLSELYIIEIVFQYLGFCGESFGIISRRVRRRSLPPFPSREKTRSASNPKRLLGLETAEENGVDPMTCGESPSRDSKGDLKETLSDQRCKSMCHKETNNWLMMTSRDVVLNLPVLFNSLTERFVAFTSPEKVCLRVWKGKL